MVWLGIVWLVYVYCGIWYLRLDPKRIPSLIAFLVMWIIVGGYFYVRDRGKAVAAA